MSQITPECKCLQYGDDTTLYRTCETNQRQAYMDNIEEDIQSSSRWSIDTNPISNSAKTKVMVISTPQMSKYHQRKEKIINL